jgi:aspartyl-tRNA(Asn)/glutamyl-tRNA(Gln) amidotransferase subunit A
MAWTSRDCALLLQAIAGPDPRDPASVEAPVPDYPAAFGGDLKGITIGVVRGFYQNDPGLNPEVGAAVAAATQRLRELGAEIEDVALPPLDDYHACCVVILLSEAFAIHEPTLKTRWREYGAILRHRLMPGALLTGSDYVQATRMRRALALEMERALERHTALLFPSSLVPAPPIEEVRPLAFYEKASLTTPANVSGHPALSVCCGYTKAGLPMGLQLVGRRFDEATLLKLGDAYERATPWRDRRPAL